MRSRNNYFLFTALSSLILWGCSRDLGLSLVKTKINNPALCGGVVNSKKIQIACAPGSGSNSYCTSVSNGSPFYVVFVPNSGGVFVDSVQGVISSCNQLWTAMSGDPSTRPVDIFGVFYAFPGSGESVTCTNGAGCSTTTTACVSGWDVNSGGPTTSAIAMVNGTTYLACAFIDTPSIGPPPNTGLIANSSGSGFATVTIAAPILFNSWTDY